MIMRVARGSTHELERLAESGGDDDTLPPAFANLLNRQRAAFVTLPPEVRAQLVTALEAHPQLRGLSPHVIESLRSGFTVVPPTIRGDGNGGADQPRPQATARQPDEVDLHKSWHVFHYLFTGRADGGTPPASLLLDGGRPVGADQGYGPGRLLDPAETAAFARFIGGLTSTELVRRINAPRMAALGIYCAGNGDSADAAELRDDVELYFPQLQAHFRAAATAGQATLVRLT
jgi:hypothetical protein